MAAPVIDHEILRQIAECEAEHQADLTQNETVQRWAGYLADLGASPEQQTEREAEAGA